MEGSPGERPSREQADIWSSDLNLTMPVLYDTTGDVTDDWEAHHSSMNAFVLDGDGVLVFKGGRVIGRDLFDDVEAVLDAELE